MIAWDCAVNKVVLPKQVDGVMMCRGLQDDRRIGCIYSVDRCTFSVRDNRRTVHIRSDLATRLRGLPIYVVGKWYIPVAHGDKLVLRGENSYGSQGHHAINFSCGHNVNSPHVHVPLADRTYVSNGGKLCVEPKEGQIPIHPVCMRMDGTWSQQAMDYAEGALWSVDWRNPVVLTRRDTRFGIETVNSAPDVTIYGSEDGLLHAYSTLDDDSATETMLYDIRADSWYYGETIGHRATVFLAPH